MINFSLKLKELRKEKGLSQKELAELLQIKQSKISKWEKGIQLPKALNLIKVAKFFNVSTDFLLGLKDK